MKPMITNRSMTCIGLVVYQWVLVAVAGGGEAEPPPWDPVAGKSYWAFKPLQRDRSPEPSDWGRSPIDHFVFERLQASDLKPADDADRRTLVRRLYFQLTGLPPSPEEMAETLLDDRPDAVTHLVDKLLSSPQFGERWGGIGSTWHVTRTRTGSMRISCSAKRGDTEIGSLTL